MSPSTPCRLALIGFGEAATTFLKGWPVAASEVAVFDLKTTVEETAAAMQDRYRAFGVAGCSSAGEAVRDAPMVVSLVTADQAVAAAASVAAALMPRALFVDGNSCNPQSKRKAASIVEESGGRYVDMAIMAPVASAGHQTPVLLAGPDATEAKERLEQLAMRPQIAGSNVGQASSIKMLRSVMIKGMEALTAECMLAARKAGVENEVLASLQASEKQTDWVRRASYNLERMMVHGVRRAAEMREVAAMIDHLGLPARLSQAVVDWQEQIGQLHLQGGPDDLADRADRILGDLPERETHNEPDRNGSL
ncbi:NAD(P)-dependent oxidoreductase [Consotaella aegiceratis]|uniref:NAD(P)-dependent oxidoreductase n=1 Tax=Consotaella aegiceratis TaxID=3097961 RepID=UPI002F404210